MTFTMKNKLKTKVYDQNGLFGSQALSFGSEVSLSIAAHLSVKGSGALALFLCLVFPAFVGKIALLNGGWLDGRFFTTFVERHGPGFHLRPDRPGLHHGLRHPAPDQFRPWRHRDGGGLRGPFHGASPSRAGPSLASAFPRRASRRHGGLGPAGFPHRTVGLPAPRTCQDSTF